MSKMEFSLSPYGTKDTEGRRQNDGFIKWTVCPNGEEGWHKVKLTLTVTQSTPLTRTQKEKEEKTVCAAAHLALLGPIPSASIFINGAGSRLRSLNGTLLTLLPCMPLSRLYSVRERRRVRFSHVVQSMPITDQRGSLLTVWIYRAWFKLKLPSYCAYSM